MKKTTLSLLFLLLAFSVSVSQRRLQIVSEPLAGNHWSVQHNDYVFFANETALSRYNGASSAVFEYPLLEGERLVDGNIRFGVSQNSSGIFTYREGLYQVLHRRSTNTYHLYRFETSTFSPVSSASLVPSSIVIFQEIVYAMVRTTAGDRLFSFDGASFSEVPGYSFTTTDSYRLMIAGDFLYIQPSSVDYLIQYDGSFHAVPDFPNQLIRNIYASPGSNHRYMQLYNSHFTYYDGASTRVITSDPSALYQTSDDPTWANNILSFISYNGSPSLKLNQCIDGTCSEIELPEGAGGALNLFRYNTDLYIPIHLDSECRIYRYDGTSLTLFFDVPEPTFLTYFKLRQGKLLFHFYGNATGATNVGYEYDGTETIPILPPTGNLIYGGFARESAPCYHYWTLSVIDSADPLTTHQVIALEVPDATCLPPPPGTVAIIPEALREYDRYAVGVVARDRECWNDFYLDWDIFCLLPTPCPPSRSQATLTDITGKIVWSKIFDKPSLETFSLKKPHALSVSVEKDKTFQQVIRLDENLVSKGMQAVSLDLSPKKYYFNLTVETKDKQQVPFSLTLRNAKGESLWQEKYIAPLNKVIAAYVEKPGAYLQLSYLETFGVSYYPNPFKGILTINVSDGNTPVSVSLSDWNGKILAKKTITTPGEHAFDVGIQKAGLYILTITQGKNIRRELVEIVQ
jgi:hypothetical protein